MSNLLPFAIVWGVLACVLVALAVRRHLMTEEEDDTVHLNADDGAIDAQVKMAQRVEALDRWVKSLTIVLALSGLVLAIFYGIAIWKITTHVGLA